MAYLFSATLAIYVFCLFLLKAWSSVTPCFVCSLSCFRKRRMHPSSLPKEKTAPTSTKKRRVHWENTSQHLSHEKNSDFPLNPGSFFVVVKSPHIPYTTRAFFFQWARHNWIWFPKNFLFEKFCPVTATRIPVPWHLITAGWFPTNRNDDILASTSHPGCHYLPPRMRRQMKVERLGFPNLKMSFQILVVTMQIASWVWVGGSSTCDIW